MGLKLNGATSGSIEIDVPAVAGTDTAITIPATTGGEFIVSDSSGNIDLGPLDINGGASDDSVNIDGSGRLLVGTTSTTLNHPIQVVGASDANAIAIIGRASDDIGELSFYENDQTTILGELQYRQDHLNFRHRVGDIRFATGGVTERMRLTSAGTLRIGGNTSADNAGYFQIITNSTAQLNNDCVAYIQHGGSDWDLILDHTHSTAYWLQFKKDNNSVYGYIVQSGSGVNYYSASDYRLKENVQDLNNSIDRLKQLQPRTYTWISHPGVTVEGFLAHEVQGVVPQAVDGEKDAVDQDGNPVYQGLDVAELVPLLTAALKEAVSKIELLETANASQAATIAALDARLTALEGGAS